MNSSTSFLISDRFCLILVLFSLSPLVTFQLVKIFAVMGLWAPPG